jgi:16S rRNA (uracil1498-N3)-methyltransferase
MKEGDEFLISCDGKSDLCVLKEFSGDTVIAEIKEEDFQDTELPVKIYLFEGLPKSDKMELIIQKCVELGVHEIIPVSMKRCVVKLDDKKSASKINRWQSISESAAKQSGRSIIPQVHDVMSYKEALNYALTMDYSLVPYELAEGMEATKDALSNIKPGMDVAVFIGPEGGFDITEIDEACNKGMTPISLGKRILRTETAGLAVMSIIMYHLEIGE